MEAATPTATQSGPENAPAQEAPAQQAAEKLIYNGQEMDVDAFLKGRKYKAKSDGEEYEVDYDELVRGYGHKKAANARMQEAAELKKMADAAAKREKALFDSIYGWKQSPEKAFDALKQLGVDVESYAHDFVLEKLKYDMMSDDEREAYDAKRELQKYKQREAQEAEAKRKQELERLHQQASTDLEQSIVKFLEGSEKHYPAPLIGRAVDQMIYAIENGQEIEVGEAFKRAEANYGRESRDIFEAELNRLISAGDIPKPLIEAVRKADIAALRKEPPKRQAPEAPRAKKEAAGVEDFFNDLEKRYRK